jgi:DNA-directed RNA polymerase sigma subunit (sigma70/sigma32)
VDWAALEVRDGEPLSLREIGEAAGVSFEAVRQIETRALIRLRVRLEALGYTAADVLAYLDGLAPGRPEPAMGDE